MLKKVFSIPDMHCSSCVMRLEGIEDDLPGIRRIKGSYAQQKLEVEFDESKVSEHQLEEAIRKLGYQVGKS